jgi:hypothetical protein
MNASELDPTSPTDGDVQDWTPMAGWVILLLLGGLLLVNGLALYIFVEGNAEGRTVGVLHAAFGAMALSVALAGFRGAGRWAWRSGWVVAGSLAALTLHMLIGGNVGLGGWYAILTGVAVLGQLLTR